MQEGGCCWISKTSDKMDVWQKVNHVPVQLQSSYETLHALGLNSGYQGYNELKYQHELLQQPITS